MKHLVVLGCALSALVGSVATADDWIALQDGKTLSGWKPAENPATWVVEDGAFVSRGERSHLFYVGKVAKHDFTNFELSAEVMTSPGANSGIYVHTRLQGPGWPAAGYELQVINSNPPAERMGGYIENKMTGSIYAVRNTWVAPVKDNEWFNYRIRVVGKTIQTFINGRLICEYAEPENAFRPPDKQGRLLSSGTFALQAHDPGSVVQFRDIKVRILPDNTATPVSLAPIADRELDQLITQASNDNIPLIDFGIPSPRGGSEEFDRDMRRLGFTPIDDFPHEALANTPASSLLVFDGDHGPDVGVLKAAKAAGMKVAFSSKPGTQKLDEALIKLRLKAIYEAGLSWKDFWMPGKP